MAARAGPKPEPLDAQALERLRRTMGTQAEFQDMLGEFLKASSRLLDDLDQALEAGRGIDVERAVHTLKSMARMVGAIRLAEACAEAEATAAVQPMPAAEAEHLRILLRDAQSEVRACLA